jgi:2-keto-4-pentenoate hydratase/2-oxohepta-3-ene-1,7-dioic acid hydratase in catechol pathway
LAAGRLAVGGERISKSPPVVSLVFHVPVYWLDEELFEQPAIAMANASATAAVVVFNDFSARDVQLAEMASGFGPQKSKHLRSAMSAIVVTADEILPHWRNLKGFVRLNGTLIAQPSTAGAKWSLGKVLAHASRAEQLYPGELFGSGTLPKGCDIESGHELKPGDVIEIGIEGIATLANPIV